MTLTPTEIEELRIAIAEEMGMNDFHTDPDDGVVTSGKWGSRKLVPPYTTSIDAIQAAVFEKNKIQHGFGNAFDAMLFYYLRSDEEFIRHKYELTALDWCIAFARTAKIWRYK